MLESLIGFREAMEHPWKVLLWTVLLTTVGILLAVQLNYHIYPGKEAFNISGLFSVIFVIIPSVFFITLMIKKQERMDEKTAARHYRKGFFERHKKNILILLFYFTGLTLTFAVWSFLLPDAVFQLQLSKINEIHGLTGQVSGLQAGMSSFMVILKNNTEVFFFAFLFSFLFGAGAVFIIVWNASILGVYIGSRLSESIWHIPLVSVSFIPHGLPEIAGYICAGLAGGIISVALLRKNSPGILRVVLADSLKILALGFVLIVAGAAIEAFL